MWAWSLLNELRKLGYINIHGIDISDESVEACKAKGIFITKIDTIEKFAENSLIKYDFITMSHVLEHIEKINIIDTLITIKSYLLAESGSFVVMVPNAQSVTGAYWMYEDFTHTTLFTSGSIYYVLKSAGFQKYPFRSLWY
ncbi:MAG: methyltransferase domain-containing protein [Saprospiraceae bacterium]|nr:methyltransferase domain-containing protein [Saprospiraceae bacterium]